MSSQESIFVNDVVIQNPKQSAVIFAVVVVLSVLMEILFSYFRNNKSIYVQGLFSQLSEEVVIIGTIGLLFVFFVQTVTSMPLSWVLLFQYVQTVIFVMMVLFVAGAVSTVLITQRLYKLIKNYELKMVGVLRTQQAAVVITHCIGSSAGEDHLAQSTNSEGSPTQDSSPNPLPPQSDPRADIFLLHSLNQGDWEQVAPKSTMQQLTLSLRRVFVDQIRDRGVTPPPLQLLLCTAELIRLSACVARKRDSILQQQRAENKEYRAKFTRLGTGSILMPLVESAEELRIVREQYRSLAGMGAPSTQLAQSNNSATDASGQKEDALGESRNSPLADVVEDGPAYDSTANMSFASYVENGSASRPRAASRVPPRQSLAARDEVDVERIKAMFERMWYPRPGSQTAASWANRWQQQQQQQQPQKEEDRCLDKTIMCTYVLFSKYLYSQLRANMIAFIDITWQCWLSIVLSSSLNSLRIFMLPSAQRPRAELTASDRMSEHLSFIFLIGYFPAVVFIVAFALQGRKFFQYIETIQHHQQASLLNSKSKTAVTSEATQGGAVLDPAQALSAFRRLSAIDHMAMMDEDSAAVWLPPRQAAGVLSGDLYDDPSRYLLRGHRSFTLHCFKIPGLLVQFYFSMFIVGVWGDISTGAGTMQIVLVPIALLPVVLVFALLPLGLYMVTCLTCLGMRLDKRTVRVAALRSARRVGRRMSSFLKKSGTWSPSLRSCGGAPRPSRRSGSFVEGDTDDDSDEDAVSDDGSDLINFDAIAETLAESRDAETAASDSILASSLERSILGIVRPVASSAVLSTPSDPPDSQSFPNTSQLHRSSVTSSTGAAEADAAAEARRVAEALQARVEVLQRLCTLHGINTPPEVTVAKDAVAPVLQPILSMYRDLVGRQKDEIHLLRQQLADASGLSKRRQVEETLLAVASSRPESSNAAVELSSPQATSEAGLPHALLAARKYQRSLVDVSVSRAPSHASPARSLQELHNAVAGVDPNTI
jgi:hypothetical protein